MFVAELGGEPAGYVALEQSDDALRIEQLCVHPAHEAEGDRRAAARLGGGLRDLRPGRIGSRSSSRPGTSAPSRSTAAAGFVARGAGAARARPPARPVAADRPAGVAQRTLNTGATGPQYRPGYKGNRRWQADASSPAPPGCSRPPVLGAGLALGGAAALRRPRREDDDGPRDPGRRLPGGRDDLGAPAALSINDIYRRAAPGVVQVTSTTVVTVPADPFFGSQFFPQQQQQQSLGSGFVVDKAGHIVTNYHVIDGRKPIQVRFSNDASMKATLVGTDPSTDIAVLKVDTSSRALTPLAARRLRPGPGRRRGRRDRQPVRPRPDRHRRDRQRDPARDHRAERLHDRPRHPDRRGDQPRQLRRPAAERARRGDRRQLADRDRRHRPQRQRRRRLRRPLEHRQDRGRPADRAGQGRPRVHRHQRGADHRAIAQVFRLPVSTGPGGPERAARQRRREGGPRRPARPRSCSPARATASAATSSSRPTGQPVATSTSCATSSPRRSPATRSQLEIYRDRQARRPSTSSSDGNRPRRPDSRPDRTP